MSEGYHLPVMPSQVIESLALQAGATVVDCTLGGGGHAALLLQAITPGGTLIGVDRDSDAIEEAGASLVDPLCSIELRKARFEDVLEVLGEERIGSIDGLLFDLGVSSHQLDASHRGFTFRQDGPLDMRMDGEGEVSAADILNSYPQDQLTRIFREYGEERWAGRIAEFVIDRRSDAPYSSSSQLVETIKAAIPAGARRASKGHPARRVFQALRIEVNGELDRLADIVRDANRALKLGGRAVFIAYHSLEDRIVKRTIREMVAEGSALAVTKKAVRPSKNEAERNPRARSARLRSWERAA